MKGFITIQDAAELSGKSIQTIRRAIKAGKVVTQKKKTPQGFVYSLLRESVCEYYGIVGERAKIKNEDDQVRVTEGGSVEVSEVVEMKGSEKGESISSELITRDDFKALTKTLEKMVTQHADERQNFLRLVNSMQEKIFVMENKINLLQEPERKWFQFWR